MRAGLTGTALFAEELALMPPEFVKDICEIVRDEGKPMELGRLYLFYLDWEKTGKPPLAILADAKAATRPAT